MHKARQRKRQGAERTARVDQLCKRLLPSVAKPVLGLCGLATEERINWSALPPSVDPVRSGQVDAERGQRKRWQIESFRVILDAIVGGTCLRIVDFCCGSGNFGLALAALLPQCSFTLLDRNVHATNLARQRASDAGLANVTVEVGNVEDFVGDFDVALAMHACGSASDHAQAAAIRSRASFIMAPCCVGKLKQNLSSADEGEEALLVGPRSKCMRLSCEIEEYLELASFADHEAAARTGATGRLCKLLIEHDRAAYARECGWTTLSGWMVPKRASAKCDVIVGLAPHHAASAEERLRSNAAAFAAATAADDAVGQCEECVADSNPDPVLPTSSAPAAVALLPSCKSIPPSSGASPDATQTKAAVPVGKQCAFFIARRQRQCRQPAEGTGDMCAAHSSPELREAAASQHRARRASSILVGDTLESLSVAACIGLLVKVQGREGLVVSGDPNKDLVVQLAEAGQEGRSEGEGEEGGAEDGMREGENGTDGDGGSSPHREWSPQGTLRASSIVHVARREVTLAREVHWSAPAPSATEKPRDRSRGGPSNPLALHNLRAEVSDECLDAAWALLQEGTGTTARMLHVDLGCHDGRYILEAAAAAGDASNVAWLGLDFQLDLAARLSSDAPDAPARAFLCCNCHQLEVLARLLDRLEARGLPLGSVSIVRPTPWPKARHAQRRLLSGSLLSLLHARMAPGGRMLLACEDSVADGYERLVLEQPGRPWRRAPPAASFPPSAADAVEADGVRVLRFDWAERHGHGPCEVR